MLFFIYLEPYRNRPSSGSSMTYSQYIRPVSAATPCTNSNIHSHNFNNNDDDGDINDDDDRYSYEYNKNKKIA